MLLSISRKLVCTFIFVFIRISRLESHWWLHIQRNAIRNPARINFASDNGVTSFDGPKMNALIPSLFSGELFVPQLSFISSLWCVFIDLSRILTRLHDTPLFTVTFNSAQKRAKSRDAHMLNGL